MRASVGSPIPALCLRIPGTRLDLALQNGIEHSRRSRMTGIQISVQAHFDSKLAIWNTPLRRWAREIRWEFMGSAAGEDLPKIEQQSSRVQREQLSDQRQINQVFGTAADSAPFIASRVCVQLFSNLTRQRNHGNRDGFDAGEPEQVWGCQCLGLTDGNAVPLPNVHEKGLEQPTSERGLNSEPVSTAHAVGISGRPFHLEREEVTQVLDGCFDQPFEQFVLLDLPGEIDVASRASPACHAQLQSEPALERPLIRRDA